MSVVLIVVAVAALALGSVNGVQAITGRRLSSRPSVRSDAQMRRESAIAATVLIVVAVIALLVA